MRARTLRRALTAAGITLILSAGTGWACEGWVLWDKIVIYEDGRIWPDIWEPVEAFESQAQCQQRQTMYSMKRDRPEDRETHILRCFPHGFNPRR